MLELKKIREHLAEKTRDLLLLELVLQTQVPIQAILHLRVNDLKDLSIGDLFPFASRGESGLSNQRINTEIFDACSRYLNETRPKDDDYLFKSRKSDQPLSVQSVSRIVKGWREATGVKEISGLPALRQARRKELAEMKLQAVGMRGIPAPEIEVLPKVQNKSLQEIVYSELENAILSGKIAPGQKLVTEEISRLMDVSRIPVREAMGRLEARGLITTKPKWGSIVNELSRKNLQEISEIRLLLEPRAASKAASLADHNFIVKLEKAQAKFAQARTTTETRQLLQSNRQFHFLIYKQADSPMLMELIKQLWDRVSPYYHIMFKQSLDKSPTVGVSYHEKIVNAMRNHDAEQAHQWIKADLLDSTDYILRLFDYFKMEQKVG